MLPSSKRLRASDVERVLGKGLSFAGGSIRGKALPRSATSTQSRFAVVVSKKTAGNAVIRNRIRRWAFEAIAASPTPKEAYDVALLISKKYETFSALQADMTAALERLVHRGAHA